MLAGLAVAAGALVQGTVGFGMSLVSAPLLALLDPALVPVPLLVMAAAHASLSVVREYRAVDWPGVGYALLGRMPGTLLGVLAVSLLPARKFALFVGLSVLACVALSVVAWRPSPTRRALLVAGAASGVTGTAAAIGGPPVALLYQHASGPRVRATLAAFFVLGAVVSLVALGVVGQVTGHTLRVAGLLLPFMVAGFLLSGPARRPLDRQWTRPAVLGVAVVSALALLLQAVAPW